jgi:DNA-directed RNA polymerase specialized sigma24 family protein
MLTRAELDSLYRANRHVVRRRLRAWRQLQPADREDVEQKMWLKLVTSKTAERRDSNVAFLKRCANNAAKSFLDARNAQKNDADKTESLGDEIGADTSKDVRGVSSEKSDRVSSGNSGPSNESLPPVPKGRRGSR